MHREGENPPVSSIILVKVARMASYLTLDESAKQLGISANELIEMRSRGEIFGFRDGTSWKFKSDEIERVQRELSGDVLDDDAGGSSILVSERQGGSSKSGVVLGSDITPNSSSKSDLQLDADQPDFGSDVSLVPDPSSGSGLRLVNRNTPTPSDGDDDVLDFADDDSEMEIDASSLSLGPGSNPKNATDSGLGSDLRLASDEPSSKSKGGSPAKTPVPSPADSDVIGGSDIKLQSKTQGGSPGFLGGSDSDGDIDLGNELELASDDNDDLVLGSNSDLGLNTDSGINLMTPSDSGLSLEDEPLDLAGTGISGLDLGGASGSDVGSGVGSDLPPGGSGAGLSGVDFSAAEDFQLSPSDGIEVEEDSGSQVIEIEDSTEMGSDFGNEALGMPGGEGGFADDGFGAGEIAVGAASANAAYRGAPEVPMAFWQVGTLLLILMVLGLSGLMVTDIVRNMWSWNGEADTSITSWFTRMIINAAGMQT